MYPLYKEVVANHIEKDEIYKMIQEDGKPDDKTKDFFDHVLTIELCPYHTKSASQIGALFKKGELVYPSSQFNVSLVRYLLSKGVTVIVARSWSLWEQVLGEDINKCLRLNNPQNTVISKGNFKSEGDWESIVAKVRK